MAKRAKDDQQPDLFDWAAARDQAMARVEGNAEEASPKFSERASAFVLDYLARHGPTAGEVITDACKAAGILPHDDRAFGPIYMRLARDGCIVKVGHVARRKGRGTGGGNVWSLASGEAMDEPPGSARKE